MKNKGKNNKEIVEMTYHDNDVVIKVIDKDNNRVDTSRWTLKFGNAVGNQLEDDHAYRVWKDNDGNTFGHSEMVIRLRSGRSKTKKTAIKHMNACYNTTISIEDDKWPKGEPSIPGDHYSSTISVKGDFKLPEKLNFFYPLEIITEEGFVYHIVLAQTGSGKGFLHKLEDVGKIFNDISEIGEDAEEGDVIGGAYHLHEFTDDLKSLFGSFNNPWLLTTIGTKDNPSTARPNGFDGVLNGSEESEKVCGISVYSEHYLIDRFPHKGKKQMGYFFHEPHSTDNSENSFSLKIYS